MPAAPKNFNFISYTLQYFYKDHIVNLVLSDFTMSNLVWIEDVCVSVIWLKSGKIAGSYGTR